MSLILAQTPKGGGFWMPPDASTIAGDVDGLFTFIFWITTFFFLLVLALLVALVLKYRYRKGVREEPEYAPAHSTALELTWTIIPTVIVILVFYFGFRSYLHMAVTPPDAYEIQVTASMWNWSFTYPNGYVGNELHVPVNTPVRLILGSRDVIHSLFVPQFRVKKDVVPGRYNQFWFQATQLSPSDGFDLYCAEYCGQAHSEMRSRVFVHEMSDYKKWLEDASNWEKRMSPVQAGEMLVKSNGCIQCHSLDGNAKNGPTFKDLFGKDEPMADGSTVRVDENYMRESLYDPAAKVVRGFTVQMQSYRGRLRDRDMDAIIAYMKSISGNYKATTLPATQ